MIGRNVFGLVFVALSCVGCGSGQAGAKGRISLDGKPVEEGYISFLHPEATKKSGASVSIVRGDYDLPAARGTPPGTYRVEIYALQVTGTKVVNGEERAITKQVAPEKYNSKSELTAELKAGENPLDFDLNS